MPIIEKIYAATGTIGEAIGAPNPNKNLGDVIAFVQSIIKIALETAGMLAVFIILFAAFNYTTAYGDDAKAENAKKTIFWTIAGMIIIGLAYGIVGLFNTWLMK